MTTPTPDPPEPTSDDVINGATVDLPDGRWGRACWFPSMGGYVGKALIVPPQRPDDCCTEIFVWHDGHFPFSGECHACSSGRGPARLTVHGGQDFITFGELVEECEPDSAGDTP